MLRSAPRERRPSPRRRARTDASPSVAIAPTRTVRPGPSISSDVSSRSLARSGYPVAISSSRLVRDSLLSTNRPLGCVHLRLTRSDQHGWPPRPRQAHQAGLLIGAAPDVKIESAVDEVHVVAAVADPNAHPIGRGLEQQVVDHEVHVTLTGFHAPQPNPSRVRFGHSPTHFVDEAHTEGGLLDRLASEVSQTECAWGPRQQDGAGPTVAVEEQIGRAQV